MKAYQWSSASLCPLLPRLAIESHVDFDYTHEWVSVINSVKHTYMDNLDISALIVTVTWHTCSMRRSMGILLSDLPLWLANLLKTKLSANLWGRIRLCTTVSRRPHAYLLWLTLLHMMNRCLENTDTSLLGSCLFFIDLYTLLSSDVIKLNRICHPT